MTSTSTNGTAGSALPPPTRRLKFTHDHWMDALGLPVYSGYYIENLGALQLGRWEERGCDAAFIQLEGSQGITETRVSEVPARGVLPPVRLAFDEVVYVVEGRGATTVWRSGGERKSFEWTDKSMFLLPRHHFHQFSNTSGTRPARLLHYNYFPLLLSASPDPDAFITTSRGEAAEPEMAKSVDLEALYAEPSLKVIDVEDVAWKRRGSVWVGSFFPDMSAWDKLTETRNRGAGGRSVAMEFPGSEISCHMSMFPARTYKKAHRHGPGRAIVIPAGEGYSVMWEEGKEKVIAAWKPGSLITPPNRWFHQHFNVGQQPARYLAFHPPLQFDGHAEKVEDRARDQIEYVDEDPAVRERFEAELDKRGLTSLIPRGAYCQRDYEWTPVAV
jgi:oxalate decarboxylase/phosphoglucose isomerase-like protein (cupin superfamily)